MELLIIFLPLVNSLILGLFGRFLGSKIIKLFTFFIFCFLTVLSFYLFINIGINNNNSYLLLFTWLNSGLLDIEVEFMFDALTVTVLMVIIIISGLVHCYSFEYMLNDPHIIRFISFLSLFTFFMIILITASSLIQMFVGWEGVGVCSFLLINFWFERVQANKAAFKAIILNRVGDIFFLISIALCLIVLKTTSFNAIFLLLPLVSHIHITVFSLNILYVTVLAICLLLGIIGKSAQFGLHLWLPDAMEGPTPVSALLHAATMVIAGIFLMIRCSVIFEMSPIISLYSVLLGSVTVLLAGTISIFQVDLKKIIAYSTCSQIGYMLFICGLSQYIIGLFHLFNHAFFKALLFLCAGVIIHSLNDEQDVRKMFNLNNLMPVICILMIVGNITLGGLFFLTGFYSKDTILELSILSFQFSSSFLYWLGSFLAFWLTNQYSWLLSRLFYTKHISLLINDKLLFNRIIFNNIHSISISFFLILIILSFGSLFVGYFSRELFLNSENYFFCNSIIIENEWLIYCAEFLPFKVKVLPLIVCFILVLTIDITNISNIFFKKWFFDVLNNLLSFVLLKFTYTGLLKILDKGFLEYSGPLGVSNISYALSKIIKVNQTGLVSNYLFILISGLLSILWFLQ